MQVSLYLVLVRKIFKNKGDASNPTVAAADQQKGILFVKGGAVDARAPKFVDCLHDLPVNRIDYSLAAL